MELLYFEVSMGAKIRNRYNQVPHLTKDTRKSNVRNNLMRFLPCDDVQTRRVGGYIVFGADPIGVGVPVRFFVSVHYLLNQ